MRKLLLPLLLCSLLIVNYANAALDLELTQGVQAAIPIAVVPFSSQFSDLSNASENNVFAVITADLAHCGQFDVLPRGNMPQEPHTAQAVDFNVWQDRSINDLIVGKVKALGQGLYRVDFQLINIFSQQSNDGNNGGNRKSSRQNWQDAVILQKTFTVPRHQLRALAHHISDLVYEHLTGVKGIFSTHIAYVLVREKQGKRKYYLEVADADGHNPKTLLASYQPIMSPAWSPNGKSIAYVSFEKNRAAIYLQDVINGQRHLLTDFPGINGAPSWSPDGKKLALVLTKTGYPKIYIYTMGNKQSQPVTKGWSIDTEPSWSPDSKSLIFTSNRSGGPQIYQIDLVTKQVRRLTYDGSYNTSASFTPDGQNIVVLHRENGLYNIALQDLTTGRLTLLTGDGDDQSPSVAPNGKMVVYAKRFSGREVLAMVSIDGRIKLLLPERDGIVREPAWSPFLT